MGLEERLDLHVFQYSGRGNRDPTHQHIPRALLSSKVLVTSGRDLPPFQVHETFDDAIRISRPAAHGLTRDDGFLLSFVTATAVAGVRLYNTVGSG